MNMSELLDQKIDDAQSYSPSAKLNDQDIKAVIAMHYA